MRAIKQYRTGLLEEILNALWDFIVLYVCVFIQCKLIIKPLGSMFGVVICCLTVFRYHLLFGVGCLYIKT